MLVFIPTYNERGNVPEMCRRISQLIIPLDILFVDDNSPDGTGTLLDSLQNDHIFVLHRSGKLGIGSAHRDGILWAYSRGYSHLITMDSDFLHRPEDIPTLLEKSTSYDVVIGSRFIQNDSLQEWPLWRKFLTTSGHIITRSLLYVPYDVTGAFRVYRIDKIPKRIFEMVTSRGYSFFPESLLILDSNNFPITEVAVILPQRTYGDSKLKFRDMVQWLIFMIRLGFVRIFLRERLLLRN
jgi:dolichol-phosphate mannosyltransferase